jgi:hypothetical protein
MGTTLEGRVFFYGGIFTDNSRQRVTHHTGNIDFPTVSRMAKRGGAEKDI